MEASTVNQSMHDASRIDVKKALQGHKRTQSYASAISRVTRIPTENIKFDKFIDILFASKLEIDEMKGEVKGYV